MKLFVSFCDDLAEMKIDRASLVDNPEEISRLTQSIERGERIWSSWAEAHGGKAINVGNGEGRLEIEADYLSELPGVREQYETATGSPCSVGVGTKISEADKSLKAAQHEGGDRIVLYTEEVDDVIEDKEELNKAQPGMNQGQGAGFTGPSMNTPAAPAKPTEGSEHSEGEALRSQIENAPPPPEAPKATAADYEQLFHQLAAAQKEKPASKPSGVVDGVREQVVRVLQQVRGHAQELEQMKQTSPELYQSIVGITQAMIAMARNSLGESTQPVQKSELEKGDVIQLNPPESSGKKRRKNAEVVPLGTPANTVWDAPGTPEHGQILDPEARRRAQQGVIPNFEEPHLSVRGIGSGKNVYNYTHFLSPEVQAAGTTLSISHSPGKYDDGMLAELRDSSGALQQKVFGYPSTHPSADPAQADIWRDWINTRSRSRAQADIWRAMVNHGNWARFGQTKKSEDKIELEPSEKPSDSNKLEKDLMPGGKGDNKPDSDFDAEQLAAGIQTEMEEHGLDEARAKEVCKDHLSEDPQYYSVNKAALEAGKTGRHEVILPAGSQIDSGPSAAGRGGVIVVQDPSTGHKKHRQVRSGLVASGVDGSPTSSRNPNPGKPRQTPEPQIGTKVSS